MENKHDAVVERETQLGAGDDYIIMR